MKIMRFLIPSLLLLLCLDVLAQQKKLKYENATYEESIKTVLLYPNQQNVQAMLAPAVMKLNDRQTLRLSFDDLKNDADYYYVYFIHCNYDWTPSDLRSNMYINGYNEFEITSFDFSSESRVNYVHYNYLFPKFKTSGNYLAVVYRNQDKSDIILSRRFQVYDNQVGLGARIDRSSSTANRRTHQRIEATVNYSELRVNDPKSQIKVLVRQNERPDRTQQLQATYIDDNAKSLRYTDLNESNEFLGGNEFRFFDLSTVNFGGRNVANTTFIDNKPVTQLSIDQHRDFAYLVNLDLNGKFYIRDLEGRNNQLTAEYVEILFSLSHEKIEEEIYLLGSFNNWTKNEASQLIYNPATDRYQKNLLLKQGWYDYTYETKGDPSLIERSFFETENLYEVFVYYRNLGSRGDELVGYYRLNYNQKR